MDPRILIATSSGDARLNSQLVAKYCTKHLIKVRPVSLRSVWQWQVRPLMLSGVSQPLSLLHATAKTFQEASDGFSSRGSAGPGGGGELRNCISNQHHHPDIDTARHNALALFNSVHSAMRQWGSSVHHNGMSFYLAHAPQGTSFYHVDFTSTRPSSFEWLAFEVEHAANFARSREGRPQQSDHLPRPTAEAPRLVDQSHPRTIPSNAPLPGNPPDRDTPVRGYFHTYRATRPLNLLYIDGQGVAKCPLGTMDSQDLVLLGWNHTADTPMGHILAEFPRARAFCALAADWALTEGVKIDGFIRMGAGFEIIYCDFSPTGGLDLISVQASSFSSESHLDHSSGLFLQSPRKFEWLRAAAARFQGHPTDRLDVDWSSMVSAFAYPVNLFNPDVTRQDLPRLVNATAGGRSSIRARLKQVVIERMGSQAGKKPTIQWQGIVDSIVTRYSRRL